MAMIPRGGNTVIVGDYYAIHRIVNAICTELNSDMRSIMIDESSSSPSTFLKRSLSDSSSRSVYYAPRNSNDGFPPRNNSLKDKNTFKTFTEGFGGRGVSTRLYISEYGNHVSLWGKTKGNDVYPWKWIDEGSTYSNRFTGNPRNIMQNYVRDWHTQGYRDIFINKLGTQLKRKGWDVVR